MGDPLYLDEELGRDVGGPHEGYEATVCALSRSGTDWPDDTISVYRRTPPADLTGPRAHPAFQNETSICQMNIAPPASAASHTLCARSSLPWIGPARSALCSSHETHTPGW